MIAWYKRGGDVLLFVFFFTFVNLFIGQERASVRGNLYYWLAVAPALLMPLLRFEGTITNLLKGTAWPVAAFGVIGGIWCAARGDFTAVAQLFLIVWVIGWCTRNEARLVSKYLLTGLLAVYAFGVLKFSLQESFESYPRLMVEEPPTPAAKPSAEPADTSVRISFPEMDQTAPELDLNVWGVLPGQTAPAYRPWRVSATPNIATSAIISLFALFVLFRQRRLSVLNVSAGAASAYFALLSFVRSVTSSLLIFAGMFSVVHFMRPWPRLRLAVVLGIVLSVCVLMTCAPYLLHHFQDWGPVSRLFLRGETGMSLDDIYRQLHRPWLWAQHAKLFWDSSYLMGHGSALASVDAANIINEGHPRSDSDSFLTRLLATYGLATLPFFYFIVASAGRHLKHNDAWGVAVVAAIVWLMMTRGSVFHPTGGLFVLAFLFIAKGNDAFDDGEELRATAGDARPD